MKKKIILITLILSLFIISSLIGILFVKDVKGSSQDIPFTFESESYYKSDNPSYNYTFNVRNQTKYTGHYNATYSFENEIDGTSGIDIDYIDIDLSEGNTEVKIINSLHNHKKILSFYDNDTEYSLEVNHAFDSIETNLISEFWWNTNNTTVDNKNLRIHFRENTEVKISIRFEGNTCHNYHNTWNLIKTDLLANQWYHNRLVLNDTSNTFDWYINGILEGNDLLYYHNSTIGIDNINYVSDVLGKTYQFIDSIGYSWDYYAHYNATYSFENEIGKEGLDILFIDSIIGTDINCTIKIISKLDNHSEILELYDNNNSGNFDCYNDFGLRDSGFLEFWIRITNNSLNNLFIGLEDNSGTLRGYIYTDTDGQFHFQGSTNIDSNIDCNINTWYHIKIAFDKIPMSIDWWINTIQQTQTSYLYLEQVQLSRLTISSNINNYNFYTYIDAIGYSWDSDYTIGQNLLPTEYYAYEIGSNIIPIIETNTNIKEVDKYEFAFESFQNLYDLYDNVSSGWIEIDYDPNNLVHISEDTTNDRTIMLAGQSAFPFELGIYKEFNILSGIMNFTWKININAFGQTDNEVGIYIYSYDNTELTYIFIENGYLKYDNGTNDVVLDSDLTTTQNYTFNLYINTYDSMMILKYYENEIYQDTFFLSLQVFNKHGLGKIEFLKDHKTGSISTCKLDYIGIYINGSSITTEFGIIRNYDMIYTTPMLYFIHTNLFSFIVDNTNMSLKISEYPYVDFNDVITEICSLDIYEGFNRFNHYDTIHNGNNHINATILWIQFYNQLELFKINIEGVRLDYEFYEYGIPLRFTHNGIDTQENYFYENNNKLYFTLNSNENDTLEYIQADFVFEGILSTNRSIGFNSYFKGTCSSIFSVKFHGNTYNHFDFSKDISKFNTILTQKKWIYAFIILITDNNDNNITGNSEGYLCNINLRYYPDIELTILTLSLIEIMIPLIVLLIPTIAIASVYGKKAILPMLILMSVICFITFLIPVEIFFIIILCLGLGLFLQYKRERGNI